MNKVYEKPNAKFVSLRNEKPVAAGNCWSHAASSGNGETFTWSYDEKDFHGYIQFVTNTNCTSNGTVYYERFAYVDPDECGNADYESAAMAKIENLKTTIQNDKHLGQQLFNEEGFFPDEKPNLSL